MGKRVLKSSDGKLFTHNGKLLVIEHQAEGVLLQEKEINPKTERQEVFGEQG